MELSEFTIRLIIILIPGAIGTLLVETLTIHRKWSHTRFIISCVILGVVTFTILQLLYWLYQLLLLPFLDVFNWESLSIWGSIIDDDQKKLNPIEIALGFLLSIIIGYFVSFLLQRKLLFKVAQKLKVSRKYGDDSLYYHFLNSDDTDWVYIRDIENDLTYRGQVISYSEDESNKEIVLRNVTVYNYKSSDELYQINQVYLKFSSKDIIIELPKKI